MIMAITIIIGGALGALGRWALTHRFQPIALPEFFTPLTQTPNTAFATFPLATFVANMVACFFVGVAGAVFGSTSDGFLIIATGFCGALSTYSTYAGELLHFIEHKQWYMAVFYVAVSTFCGLILLSTPLLLA